MCFYEYVCSILVSPVQLVLPLAKQPLPDICKVSDDTFSYLWALHAWWENPLAFASTFCSLFLVFYSVTHCSSLFKILITWWYLLAAISNYTQHIFKAVSACTYSLSRRLRAPGINVSTWAYACKMPELLNFWQWPTYWNRWSGSNSESLHRCWFTHSGIAYYIAFNDHLFNLVINTYHLLIITVLNFIISIFWWFFYSWKMPKNKWTSHTPWKLIWRLKASLGMRACVWR